MNTAVLHNKIAGLPVWAIGGLGAAGIIMFKFLHKSSAATSPAAGDATNATTGDPVPVDGGSFPGQSFGPQGNGYDTGGGGGSTVDLSPVADAIASLGSEINAIPGPQDITQLSDQIGTLNDQVSMLVGQGETQRRVSAYQATAAAAAAPKVLAHANAKVGGRKAAAAAKAHPVKKAAPVKPNTHKTTPVNPKTAGAKAHTPAAPHAPAKPKPKPKPAPKRK